ncbi:MAG: hypothetical protein K6G79_04700, partial [Bacteroidales bacterium]|nr:hypothetical protein [Bacteroidales bacterium]
MDTDIPSESDFEDPEHSNGRVIRYDENDENQGFYVYERGVPTTTMLPTFIIIRGRFDEESPYYYYKLDLMKPETVNQEA